ncbi:MAG: hypothetical protein KatS3mg093_390 [Candidatus Parcubacteria bacterium]|nr:MAG: hypothetical protein KatS3mg093_390 [Candidatus Parcubacteria bacterium]
MSENLFTKLAQVKSVLEKWNKKPFSQEDSTKRSSFIKYLDYRRLPSSTQVLTKDQAPWSLKEALELQSDKIVAELTSHKSDKIIFIVVYGPPRSGTSIFPRLLANYLKGKIKCLGIN